MEDKKFIIIDSNALIHRAFHALPPLSKKNGIVVNAVYGFLLVFLRVVKEFRPDYIAATFDFPGKNFRHEEFKEYKATRKKAPQELYDQIPRVKEFLEIFNVPIFEKEGFEADDLIGTIATLVSENSGIQTIITSGDNDCLQLVNENIYAYILKKGIKDIALYDKEKVREKYDGLSPEQLIDYKALRGDPSDNIPGVMGIGEKTAIQLIKQFETLDKLYAELDDLGGLLNVNKSTQEKIKKFRQEAFVSKRLAEIKKDVPIDFSLEKCLWGKYDKLIATKKLRDYEFYSLVDRLP
jgi:DNA polymerase I